MPVGERVVIMRDLVALVTTGAVRVVDGMPTAWPATSRRPNG